MILPGATGRISDVNLFFKILFKTVTETFMAICATKKQIKIVLF